MNEEAYVGRWWSKVGSRVLCSLCPRHCSLNEGQRGFCFVRQNIDGKLRLTTYGRSTGFCIDPIEKKPLNHFLPGTATLSFGTAGCNLGCKFCQNWDISKSRSIEKLSAIASPEQIVARALETGCRSVAFTYNDPVIWAEYAIDTAMAARKNGLKTVAVTAGYITPEARPDFFAVIDAANVDLKAFSEEFYRSVTLSQIEPVKDTLKWLARETDIWFEITNLVIPGLNDSQDELRRLSNWVANELSPDIPVHFTAFHPDYKIQDRPATPVELLCLAQDIARSEGLRFAYIGNCNEPDRQSTYCPTCGEKLIQRDHYTINSYRLNQERCIACQSILPGVFEEAAGDWGPRRMPIQISEHSEHAVIYHIGSRLGAQKSNNSGRESEMRTRELTVSETVRKNFSPTEQTQLLEYAHDLLRFELSGASNSPLETSKPPDIAKNSLVYGIFLTLERGTLLRACRGYWGASAGVPLDECLQNVVRETALSDPRFPRISISELDFLQVELSILHTPREFLPEDSEELVSQIEVGTHGLVVLHRQGRGLLLPQVASERGWTSSEFLHQTCRKAQLPDNAWKQATVITFEAAHFLRHPTQKEILPFTVDGATICELISGTSSLHEALSKNAESHYGIEFLFENGVRKIIFSDTESPLSLIAREGAEDVIRSLRLLYLPIDLHPQDYPSRTQNYRPYVTAARSGEQTALALPSTIHDDTIRRALAALDVTPADWLKGHAQARIYFLADIFDMTRAALAERHLEAKNFNSLRLPAVAGRFYPDDAKRCKEELERFFALANTSFGSSDEQVQALLLPHAGWNYCGEVMSAVVNRARIPNRIIVISPKHTDSGPQVSVSDASTWRLPTQDVEIDRELVKNIQKIFPAIEVESEAHRLEHGVEVILPFLTYRNPQIAIAPIVIGRISLEEALSVGVRLANLLTPETLLVISSDMNHFDADQTTRAKDRRALDAIEDKDPSRLYQICKSDRISMCGLLPCVVGLAALNKKASLAHQRYNVSLVHYQTSANFSGETERTVGYAGLQFKFQTITA